MTTLTTWHQPKRLVSALVTAALLLQTALPAYATVMQVPGIYLAPPDPNVMFSLDDSGSMTSDAIPDFGSNVTGMPTNDASASLNGFGSQFPGMWKPSSQYLSPNLGGGNLYQWNNPVARYLRSSAGNPLYYDPKVTYKPWPRVDNDTLTFPDADPAAVLIHHSSPRLADRSVNPAATTVDLTTQRTRRTNIAQIDTPEGDGNSFWPATYYVYTGGTPLTAANPADPNNIQSNFRKFEIPGSGNTATFDRAATRTDCSGAVLPATGGCSRAEEMQNFANWLQYYRSRMLMAKGGVAAAFARQGTNLRAGFTSINSATIVQRVATFTGTARQNFYTNLYNENADGSTPLRVAMDRVGRYFSTSGTGSPWGENTAGSPRPREDSCRKSFHILSTDGFWNDRDADVPTAPLADNDFFAPAELTPPQPDGRQYRYRDDGTAGTLDARFTVNPFRDNNSLNVNTLANVAAYYWKTDLQPSLDNRLAVSSRDPAYWQHLTTFTVGLGVSGSGAVRPTEDRLWQRNAANEYIVSNALPSDDVFYPYRGKTWLSDPDLRDLLVAHKTSLIWPTTANGGRTTGDDLIHAAMNARGRYLSATNPTDLASGLASALAEATNQTSSFASLGLANTSETAANNRLFQAVYNPYGWTGRLYAFTLANGSFSTNPRDALWEASKRMPAAENRSIFTWNPTGPSPQGSLFTWDGLTTDQRLALGPTAGVGSSVAERQDVLDFLRGSIAREVQSGGPLRDRVRERLDSGALGGVLGDIVGGSPLKGPDFGGGYERMRPTAPGRDVYAGATGYRTADESQSRIGTMRQSVFFGANDGMLRAVNAADGSERFAFVPNSVFDVPRTTYKGTTTSVKKLYELSRPDYGHLFTVNGPPQIADAFVGPTLNHEWRSILLGTTGAGARSVFAMDVTNPQVGAAVNPFNTGKILWEFSEAQNADMGHIPSYPHVAKMQDGTWVAMFGNGYDSSSGRAKLFLLDLYTGAVVWEQAVGSAGSNGLSQPNFLLNQYREVVAIWAGDLRGNMWKFDVNSPTRSDWRVAYGGNPLFTAPTNQPITVMPELARFPNSNQAMVLFGTGKLFDTEDNATDSTNQNLTRQALYGIWDNEATRVTSRSQLVEQTVTTGSTNGYRRTSENAIDWAIRRGWYLQLEDATGERVHVNPVIPVEGRATPVFFVANTPTNVPCSSGGTSRVFALDPITGQTPRFSVFDTDRSGSINSDDNRNNVMSVSVGILSLPSFLVGRAPGGVLTEKPGTRGQTGAREGGVEFKDGGSSTACTNASGGRMIAGVSDTSAVNETVRLNECKGRVSWRQIK